MRYPAFLLLLLIVLSTASCIPTRKLTYLQESEVANDSLVSLHQEQPPYRLQISDVLSIRIKALDQELVEMFNPSGTASTTLDEGYYYDGFAIDRHGNIRMPTLGEISVLGRTTEEVREIVEKRLMDEFLKPEAKLYVTVKLAGIQYTIAGETGGPGVKRELTEKLSLMDAIANSGGVTETGDLTDITVIRQYPGGQRVHHVDLTQLEAMQSPYYYVKPNDLILVNPLPQKSIGIGTTGLSSFTTILSVFTALLTTVLFFTRI